MSFADNLKAIRKQNHMSQECLAEMLGVSRQAVSKWELEDGYPEVDKLILLSQKMGVSLDTLLLGSVENEAALKEEVKAEVTEGKAMTAPTGRIRITSPNEGVIAPVTRVTRSQEYKNGKKSPRYALFGSEGEVSSFSQNTFLAWYRNLEDITKEIEEIHKAMDAGEAAYTLQYSVKTKNDLFRTIIE